MKRLTKRQEESGVGTKELEVCSCLNVVREQQHEDERLGTKPGFSSAVELYVD